jgi:hypothetical protein
MPDLVPQPETQGVGHIDVRADEKLTAFLELESG